MRWPWQRREPVEPAPDRGAPPVQRDGAEPSPMGWAFLPPLQRQLGDMPLVARAESFPSQLPAWQNPSFTGTLAHRVSTDAPSGVIDGDGGGTGEPSVHSGSPDLTLLAPAPVRPTPVQRATSVSSPSDGGAPAPLTTAAPSGLPVLVVQSYEAPADPPADTTAEVVSDDPASEVDAIATSATTDRHEDPHAPVAGDPTPESRAPAPVQRSIDSGQASVVATSSTSPATRVRPEVGGRRLGLGAPLPTLPLASDVPPVQRTDVPPLLGSEGGEGYVEVDIPARQTRSEAPARPTEPMVPREVTRPAESAETGAPAVPTVPAVKDTEPDAPTLASEVAEHETGLDAAGTPGPVTSAPPDMPTAPIQRSVSDSSDAPSPGLGESIADGSTPGAPNTEEARLAPEKTHHVTASTAADDGPMAEPDPRPPSNAVSDRPVLAQRSLATGAEPFSDPDVEPGAGHGATPAPSLAAARPTLVGKNAAQAGAPEIQRTPAAPFATGPIELSLQRTTSDSASPEGIGSGAIDTSDHHAAVMEAPPPDRPATWSATEADGTGTADMNGEAPLSIANPTRPTLATAAPLLGPATATVQRSTDTVDVRSHAGPSWSPPVSTRQAERPSAAVQTHTRPTWHGAGVPAVQRAAGGAHLQRAVSTASDGGTGLAKSPEPSSPVGVPEMPLAAPAAGEDAPVQPAVVEDVAPDAAGVPGDAAAPTTREAGVAAAAAASPGGGAAGAAGATSPEELEALAGRLFTPLMRRIRSEMLLDRERRGLRTDSW
ncbi:MAG: hypothetical protein AVDCRST_MAG47-1727 [uncultured Nocardioidaceae bacterium]|uniref:Uncharacterized protein n=1 Tax=uncultured Nocardioidaceae bacterium TaxID=253824 RepID=A0A6J4N3T7_9ACTN|nr:MAG: hypothetical protein AVDCRST_MAG47-1727 [uncultured Nocardioidaceae bacterium]